MWGTDTWYVDGDPCDLSLCLALAGVGAPFRGGGWKGSVEPTQNQSVTHVMSEGPWLCKSVVM